MNLLAKCFNNPHLKDKDHKHVPYLVPLFQALKKWQNDKCHFPRTFKEKKEIRDLYRQMQRMKNDEENFEEGYKACVKLLKATEVPNSVKDLLKHEKVANITPDSDIFWCLLRG